MPDTDRRLFPVRLVRLFQIETARLMCRTVFWAGAVVVSGVAWSNMVMSTFAEEPLFGAFTYHAVADNLVFALVIFVSVGVSGALAADRKRGYPTLVFVRGVSRMQYLIVKAAAMTTAAGGGTGLACGVAYLAAAPFLKWPAVAVAHPSGPYPHLVAANPLAGDAVLVTLLCAGAAGLALSGLAFGAAVANDYLASAVPFVLLVGGIFIFRTDSMLFLGPYTQLSLVGSYTYALPQWAWPFTAPLYWSVFAVICLFVASMIFARREEV